MAVTAGEKAPDKSPMNKAEVHTTLLVSLWSDVMRRGTF